MPDNRHNMPASLATEFCGLTLSSPIVLLSGCVGFGEEYTRVAGFSNREHPVAAPVAMDAATPDLFDRTRGKGVQSPHKWSKYWEVLLDARDIFGPQKFGAHIIVGMGETEYEVLNLAQEVVDLGGHNHMFCFFPEQGSLMDHLPATPRDQWRRVQLARYLIDYRGVRVQQMKFDEHGRVLEFGIGSAELDDIINAGVAFRTSGCPGKFQDDISACDRPYGDSPPSNIASFPYAPKKKDMKKIRKQLKVPIRIA